MVELVDTLDLGPSDFCYVGSSPTVCTSRILVYRFLCFFSKKKILRLMEKIPGYCLKIPATFNYLQLFIGIFNCFSGGRAGGSELKL